MVARKKPAPKPKLTGLEREDAVVQLAAAGLEFAEIATELGFASAASARAAHTRAKKRTPSPDAVPALTPEQLKAESDVLDLRRAGVAFPTIAARLELPGPDEAEAMFLRALDRVFSEINNDPVAVRRLDLDRLDRLQVALWPKAVKGDVAAVDRVLKISEQRDRLRAMPQSTGDLRTAYDATVEASNAIGDVDAAIVAAGRVLVDRIEKATATGEGQEVTKALYLVPHLNNILRELLATPAARKAIADEAKKGESGGGSLSKLRLAHSGKGA